MNLKADDNMSIGTTFSDEHYCISIPLNQRKFDWKPEEQVQEFWNDFRKILDGDNHYFGVLSFVVADDHINTSRPQKSLLVVTDGQQRLLTTSLLIAALRDVYFALDEEEEAKRIHKKFLLVTRVREEFQKLTVSNIDTYTFNQVVNCHSIRGKKINLIPDYDIKLEEGQHRNIVRNESEFINEKIADSYTFFYNELVSDLCAKESIEEKMDWLELIEKKLDETYVIWITSEDPDFLYTFFETLNNRGLKLNQMDIIRNKLLDIVSEIVKNEMNKEFSPEEIKDEVTFKVREVSEMWDELVIKLTDLDITKYLKYYFMAAKEKILSANKLPSEYERFFKGIETYENLKEEVNKMINYSRIYYKFHNLSSSFQDIKISEMHIANINSFKQQAGYSFLMDYYAEVEDEKRRSAITKYIEVLMFRRVICSSSTKELDKIYLEMIKCKESNYDDEKLLLVIEKYLPEDENFKFHFKNRYWERDTITNYVLRQYEYELMDEEVEFSRRIKDRSEVHIEHIAPYSPTTEWLKSLNKDQSEYNKVVGNIGNLVLLKKELNLKAKQKQFVEKKNVYYKDSELDQVKEVCKSSSWNEEEIQTRNQTILDTCFVKWEI